MTYLGEYTPGKTIIKRFNTHKADGTPITLSGTPAVSVYKNSTTESVTGVTLTVDYDSRTGLHHVAIDTSADGTFYAAGNDFSIVITAGTVDGVSVVGTEVGSFSLANRAGLRPTMADRTLDVSAGGEAGVDWANVGSPTTTLALSGTSVKTATDVETDTQDIQSRLPAALVGGRMNSDTQAIADGVITSAKFTVSAITGVATGLLEQLRQLWMDRFYRSTIDRVSGQQKTFAADDSTVLTTQAVSDNGTTQVRGKAT